MWIFDCSVVFGVSSVKESVNVHVLSVPIVLGHTIKNRWCIHLQSCALYILAAALPKNTRLDTFKSGISFLRWNDTPADWGCGRISAPDFHEPIRLYWCASPGFSCIRNVDKESLCITICSGTVRGTGAKFQIVCTPQATRRLHTPCALSAGTVMIPTETA